MPSNHTTSSPIRSEWNLMRAIRDGIPSGTELFSVDGNKEIGFLAILAWHHGIAKLANRMQLSVPPVLLSTVGTLIGLTAIRAVSGKDTTDHIVKYFDPSVDFLGTWMSLWLVPSLVLLPNALQKIEKSDRTMWVKLILTHFILWYASTLGTAKLYEMIERSTKVPNEILKDSDLPSETTTATLPDKGEVLILDGAAALDGGEAETTACTVNTESDEGDKMKPDPANSYSSDEEAKAEKLRKQIKLLRFWGAVTACFYAAPFGGLMSSKVPALGGTTITALIAGQMLPTGVKKVLHPLVLATAVSALAAVISDRFMNVGERGFEDSFDVRGKSWIDSLFCYTTPTAACATAVPTAYKCGDYFAMVLGPACTALAFRIFSQSEKLHSKLPAILAASTVSAVTSLFVSPLLGATVGIPSELNAALAHRSISSALAVPSARLTGASCELTVAAVLLTGLYGASGQWLLDRHNVTDEIAAGVAVGTAAHSIGTASLLPSRPQAAAVASVALVSSGIAHAVVCAVPGVPAFVKKLATVRFQP